MRHIITDREFRDFAKEANYPFADTALLVNDQGIRISPGVFLDALIYSLEDVTQPFYIGSLDGTVGDLTQMKVTIKDDNNAIVCTGTIDTSKDTCYLYDSVGRTAGTLVYDTSNMAALVGRVGILKQEFSKTQTPLVASRGFVTRSKGLSVVSSEEGDVSEDVYIVGANGVHFTQESGVVYIHLLGEESLTDKPIKTINGQEFDHVWVAAKPNSDIKVETTGSGLKIWKITDAQ